MNAPPELIVSLAVDTANRGPCAKSKRGVVIYSVATAGGVGVIWGNAFNSPPWPFECSNTDACKADCGRICVHAEQRAIIQALTPSETELRHPLAGDPRAELHLVHVKTVDGKLVPSPGGPSCDQCAKLILEAGIRTVWLYVQDGVWSRYDAAGFHQATLITNKLHRHL
jgi:deoxycytidylate deaminase